MKFLCKKCGAQSPGDISDVEIRDGALVFTCKACGASATLVASRATGGARPSAGGAPAEKGIVEPDEDELVDLGEATLSSMLGRKVRIVAEPADAPETAVPPPGQNGEPEPAPEPAPAPPDPVNVPVLTAGGSPFPTFAVEPDAPPRSRRSRIFLAVAASVGLVAVATVALLEARPQRSPSGSVPASPNLASPESALHPANSEPAPVAAQPELAPAATPSVVPAGPNRDVPQAAEPAPLIELKELAVQAPPPVGPGPTRQGLTAEQIDEAFFRVRPAVRLCAVQEQRRHPDAKLGNETVTLTVAPSGEVAHVEFESHEIGGTPLGACLAVELEKLRVEAFDGPSTAIRRVLELSRHGSTAN